MMARKLWIAAALAGISLSAAAHRPWLLPSSTIAEENRGEPPVVTIDAAISEDLFKFDSFPLKLDELIVTGPDGTRVPTSARSEARRRVTFDVTLPKQGTYRVTGITDSTMASWKVNGETKRWRGTADEMAKAVPADAQDLQVTRMLGKVETFVSYESSSAVPAPAPGLGLSLQPLTSPTDLSAGDTTRFLLTLDGKPLPDADVTVIRGDNRYRYKMGEIALKSGPDGTFAVQWPQAGEWWLGVNHGGRGGPGGGEGGEGMGSGKGGGNSTDNDGKPRAPGTGTGSRGGNSIDNDGKPRGPQRRESYSATFEVLPK